MATTPNGEAEVSYRTPTDRSPAAILSENLRFRQKAMSYVNIANASHGIG